jgi:hypothetical protein
MGRPRIIEDPEEARAARVRASNLWRLYRIRPGEYDAARAEQDYRCAICRRHEDEIPVRSGGRPRKDGTPTTDAMPLTVDHCHASTRRRKLLCNPCNVGLGGFRDDPALLLAAVEYLAEHRSDQA